MAKGQNRHPEEDSGAPAATLGSGPSGLSERRAGGGIDEPCDRRPAWQFWVNLTFRASAPVDERFWDNQGLLWCAFAFAAGIAVYTLLPEEPNWPLLTVLVGASFLAVVWTGHRAALSKPAILALALACGLTVAALRTSYVDAPRLGEPMNVSLTGHVVERQTGAAGTRVLLEVETVDDRPRTELAFPERVRLRLPADNGTGAGETIRVRARLFPPPGPVSPGGYDFSYRAYFSRIGATGFSYGPATVMEAGEIPLTLRAAAQVQHLRDGLAARIRTVLPDSPETALIIALLVGDRGGISEAHEENLRAAGLAHILAISGLHMALFAGGAYSAALLFLALFPPLALRWPTHKWAAVAALSAAVAYLLISGAAVATQRSFLMIALVFLGIFVGRRGLTLRSVALAGLFLLLAAPERLFFPGFQMSFAAVICLVAVYELWRGREKAWHLTDHRAAGQGRRLLQFIAKWVTGLFVTALVAGIATGIIGAHHFGRIAPYGLLGNLLGMPVFSLLVMPMGVLALVLMPLGLSALPLTIMAFGLSLLLKIAAFTAALSDGAGVVGTLGGVATLLLVSALFTGLLLPGWRRLCALAPLGAALVAFAEERPPDIQIAAAGSRIAARDETGSLRLSSGRQSFAGEIWLQHEGVSDDAIKSLKMKSPQRQCDRDGCVILAYADWSDSDIGNSGVVPLTISLPKTAQALPTDCLYADIIVTDLIAPSNCRAGVVFQGDLRQKRGAVSIWLSPEPPLEPREYEQPLRDGSTEHARLTPAMLKTGTGKLKIVKVAYAIPDPPRPWHRPGTVTRASLRQRPDTPDR